MIYKLRTKSRLLRLPWQDPAGCRPPSQRHAGPRCRCTTCHARPLPHQYVPGLVSYVGGCAAGADCPAAWRWVCTPSAVAVGTLLPPPLPVPPATAAACSAAAALAAAAAAALRLASSAHNKDCILIIKRVPREEGEKVLTQHTTMSNTQGGNRQSLESSLWQG